MINEIFISENEDQSYDWILYPGTIGTSTSTSTSSVIETIVTIDPKVMLRISSDTRSLSLTQPTKSYGKIGKYDKRVIWRRLGQHRSFTPIISISSPAKRAIYTAYINIESCSS